MEIDAATRTNDDLRGEHIRADAMRYEKLRAGKHQAPRALTPHNAAAPLSEADQGLSFRAMFSRSGPRSKPIAAPGGHSIAEGRRSDQSVPFVTSRGMPARDPLASEHSLLPAGVPGQRLGEIACVPECFSGLSGNLPPETGCMLTNQPTSPPMDVPPQPASETERKVSARSESDIDDATAGCADSRTEPVTLSRDLENRLALEAQTLGLAPVPAGSNQAIGGSADNRRGDGPTNPEAWSRLVEYVEVLERSEDSSARLVLGEEVMGGVAVHVRHTGAGVDVRLTGIKQAVVPSDPAVDALLKKLEDRDIQVANVRCS